MNSGFHFGNLLKKIILERKMTRVEITNNMKVAAPVLYAYEERASLQLYIILRLCHAMKYNLLMDIASSLPEEYEYDREAKAKHHEKMMQLEEENKKLKWENDLLKDMIMKKI